jgi:phospho-N-acetylmuramoyl-pentapeptide-transferase
MEDMVTIGLVAILLSFAMTTLMGPLLISLIKRQQVVQQIRDDGPQSHLKKAGTPTMGGIMMLLPISIVTLLLGESFQLLFPALLLMWGFALIGFADDWGKLKSKSHRGLSGKLRLMLESIIASLFMFWLMSQGHSSELVIPFTALSISVPVAWYIALSVLVIVGTSNAVNLTDGLDGLAIVPICVVSAFFAITLWFFTILTPSLIGLGVLCATIMGAGAGFLWFNTNPAKIFMGDFGSLSLGAILAVIAVCLHMHLFLLLIGALFVIETLSVIIQVVSYKTRKKRVFKMAPLHHHFELSGWTENQVIVRSWIMSFMMLILALLHFGWRG